MSRRDISNKEDVRELVYSFYEDVRDDQLIGPFFTEYVSIDWEMHLPKMVDFWESVLFATHSYQGNPMRKHLILHQDHPLEAIHFNRWLELFERKVDELFEGNRAELAKQRANSIAMLIQHKINQKINFS